jgi:hypothetical protein
VAKDPKSNTAAFRRLEAELADLCRDEHQNTEEAAARADARIANVQARIKDICKLAYPEDPGFGESFLRLLRNRFRSSGAFTDYAQERDRLLVRLSEMSADKHRRTLEESKRLTADSKVKRNEQMIEEYRRKKDSSDLSASDLKAEIGKGHGLGRSASIVVIDRGLKPAKPRKA